MVVIYRREWCPDALGMVSRKDGGEQAPNESPTRMPVRHRGHPSPRARRPGNCRRVAATSPGRSDCRCLGRYSDAAEALAEIG